MKKYIIIFAAAFTFAACAQKELDTIQDAEKVRFTAIMEGANISTKTYLGAEEGGLYPVYWSEGDKIKMFVSQHEISDGQGYQLDLESGAGTVESVFSGSVPVLPDGSLYYYAVYPYSLAASIGGVNAWDSGTSPAEETWDPGDGNVWELSNYVQIPLPSVQQYSPHSFGKDYNPAIAVSRDQTLRFKNTCGILRINLTGNIRVGKITITGDGEAALWGTLVARYRWRQHSSDSEFKAFVVNGQSSNQYLDLNRKMVTLDCGEGVQLSNTVTDFNIVLPIIGRFKWNDGTWYDSDDSPLEEGFTIRIYDNNGVEVFAKHTERDNSIHRSMIRNMPTLDVRTQSYTNLSSNGTANAYIVAPDGGSYSFYAGNRGNSPMPIHDNLAAIFPSVEAVVLWETRMTGATALHDIIDNVTFDPATGYISFTSTNNPGNALIALKDANDIILWSWHIWSTDYDPEVSYDTYGTAVLMDRNLGALKKSVDDVSAYGLYYNWGRKDPFDIRYEPASRRYLYFPSNPFSLVDGVRVTLSELAKNPTAIYSQGPDFYACEEGDMPQSDLTELWGKKKTMYDPCPPGWQVADFEPFYQYTGSLAAELNFTPQSGYSLFNSSSPAAVYPREQSVWTSHKHRSFVGAIHLNVDTKKLEVGQYPSGFNHVRCQKSSTVTDFRPVIDLSSSGTANCYMARPRNKYKFNATVKGNTNISSGMAANAIVSLTTENTTSLSGREYHTYEDALIYDCYLKDGYVYFTTSLNDVYGNATISLRDPQGDVLWSWHIWIVDYNPETNYDTVDWGEAGTKKMMKMNLGALNNTMYDSKAMGMMYQWGRKDPYLGAVAYDSNSQVVYESREYGYVEASQATSTLAYSLRHPGKAIMDEESGDGDWLEEHENALWGDSKTMYDPCPQGWKVPSRPIYNEHSVTCVYQYGLLMNDIWYPATGFHHCVSFNLNCVGLEGHYWFATPKDDGNAYSFFFDSANETVDLSNHYSPKAQLNAIRCMKDE